MLRFPCEHCHKPLRIDDALAGKKAICPYCRAVLAVPPLAAAADDEGGAAAADAQFDDAWPAGGQPDESGPATAAAVAKGRRTKAAGPASQGDEAEADGQPIAVSPDAGDDEQELMTVHPAWFVSRPGHAAIIILLALTGLACLIGGLFNPNQLPPQILFGAGAGFIIIAAGFLGFWKLTSRCTSITVTSKKLIIAQGMFTRDTLDIPLREIQDIRLTQSLHERLLGTGRLSVSNSGQEDDEVELKDIPNPQALKKAIDRARKL